MDTKDLIKYGLIGAAAYYVWTHYGDKLGIGSSLLPAGSTPAPTPTPAQQQASSTKALMMAKANITAANINSVTGNIHEWNWYYHEARGSEAPPFNFPTGADHDTYRFTLDEFLRGTGLGRLRGLNGIQPFSFPGGYFSMPRTIGMSKGRIANG